MKFLYPTFLIAFVAIVIPLIIHFFNFKRYKTVYFSNVNFLKAVKKDNKNKSRLKYWIILASRILFIVFLVLAFSQPYIPLNEKSKQKARQVVAIYIDNSFSMRLESEKGLLLQQAKDKAIEIAETYRPGTKYILINNDFLPEHRLVYNKEQFISRVTEINVSPNFANLEQINKVANQQLNKFGNRYDKSVYILSDFQTNNFDFTTALIDTSIQTILMPFSPGKTNNLFIDSCWFETPGRRIAQTERLMVNIKNSSDQTYNDIPVKLFINDSLKAISNLTIEPFKSKIIEMVFTNNYAGFQFGKVEISDYPIMYDNSYFFAYQVRKKINVLAIFNDEKESANYFSSLLNNDEFINYRETNINNLQISQIKNNDCIYLINLKSISSGLLNEINANTDKIGALAIFPSEEMDVSSYNQLYNLTISNTIINKDTTELTISEINYSSDLYKSVFKSITKNIDLPIIKTHFLFNQNNFIPESRILSFRNGAKALSKNEKDGCRIYCFAFPADNSNKDFLEHMIFVPSIYNIAINSLKGSPISQAIKLNNNYQLAKSKLKAGHEKLILKRLDSNNEFLPPVKNSANNNFRLDFGDFIKQAGHYEIKQGDKVIEALAYNYRRSESEPTFYFQKDLNELISSLNLQMYSSVDPNDHDFKEQLEELNNGKQLWRYFLIISLIFVFLEILIIRLWK